MTIAELAAYAAPIFWFSPDEPTMEGREGKAVRIPEALPFQTIPDAPVVYYQYNKVFERTLAADGDGPGYLPDALGDPHVPREIQQQHVIQLAV